MSNRLNLSHSARKFLNKYVAVCGHCRGGGLLTYYRGALEQDLRKHDMEEIELPNRIYHTELCPACCGLGLQPIPLNEFYAEHRFNHHY